MYKAGILTGNINEPYASLGATIMGDACNIIGIYYDNKFIIYRTFDGSYVDYFNSSTTLEILSTHWLVKDLTLIELDEEAWKIDGHVKEERDTLRERLKITFSNSLLSHIKKDYKLILLYYANLTDKIIMNGYTRVNEISLEACGDDISKAKDIITRSIVSTRYHKEPITISKHFKVGYADPSSKVIRKDTILYIEELSKAFTELILDDTLYQKYILTLGPSIKQKIEYEIIKVPIKKDYNDITDELESLKRSINTMISGLTTDKLPIIHIDEIIESYNSIATKFDIDVIPNTHILNLSSSALIVSGSDHIYDEKTPIQLKSGSEVILSMRDPRLSDLSYQELIELLRYLMSVNGYDNRYSRLITKVTEELASRAKQRKTI